MALDKFPVDESALPRVTITAKKLEEWKEVAHDEITRALSNRHSWYNAFKDKIREGFDMIADRPNLKAFLRPVPNTSDKDILIRSTFDNVTLDDIGFGIYSETSYDLRCALAHMYEDNFLDGGILHTHETRTVDDPLHFVGVRWIAFRSPAPKIVTSRDFVFFSYEGTMLDVKGERVIFRFLRTMPMDDVPVDASKLPPLVRGKISNLHIYRQNGSHVEAYVKAMHSNAGSMPSYIVTKTIAFMYPGVTNMESIGDARALMRQGMTRLNPSRTSDHANASFSSSGSGSMSHTGGPRAPTASLASANACGVCYHKFKMTRSKRQCHGCSRTVCKRCTRGLWFFDEQKQMSSTGVVRLRFCHNCTRHARSEASLSRTSLETTPHATSSNPSDTPRTLHMDGSRGGSGGSSQSLHRVSSQNSLLARTPSHDGSSHHSQSFPRTPSQASSHGSSIPRAPSQDSLYQNSLYRAASQSSMHSVSRGGSSHDARMPSQASQASSHHSKTSHTKSQPEAEFSDDEIFDDELHDFHDGSFSQPTQSPPTKPLASSKIMSFKSSSTNTTTSPFSSSQINHSTTTTTTTFDSSQVVNAFDGSPVTINPLERSHIGQYTGFNMARPIQSPPAGVSPGVDEDDDEDFGDFHDSDSDDVDVSNNDFDFEQFDGIVDHDDLDASLRDTTDSYSDAYSVIDSDDYSIAGSFSYDMGPQSFMSEMGTGSFSFDVDPEGNEYGSRGSFVPLTMVDKPSVVAQQFTATVGPRPHAAAPVPQLTQRRLPPQLQLQQQPRPVTLRNYASPTALDETAETARVASRTASTPNLLTYGATKRTNRPGGMGMAPVRRAVSGTGTGVIVNGVNHAVQSPSARTGDDLVHDFGASFNIQDTNETGRKPPQGFQSPGTAANSGGNSPMIRYYGS